MAPASNETGAVGSPEPAPARSMKRPRQRDADAELMGEVEDMLDEEEKGNGSAHHRSHSHHEGNGNGIAAGAGWRSVKAQYDHGRLRKKRRAMVLLGVASTASTLSINFIACRATEIPLLALPLASSITTVAATKAAVAATGTRIEGAGEGWRERLRSEGPVVAVGVLALTLRAVAAGWAELAIPQAIEVFIAPLLLALLPISGLESAIPSRRPHIATCLVSLTVALALLPQRAKVGAVVVPLLSMLFQTFHLILLKRWYVSRQPTSPLGVLARWAPLALIFSIPPFLLRKSNFDYHRPIWSLGRAARMPGWSGWTAMAVFCLCRLLEAFGEVLAIDATDGPVAVSLLAPARNLASLGFVRPLRIAIGIPDGAQLAFVYLFSALGIAVADPEVREALQPLEDDDDVGDDRFAAVAKQALAPLKPRRVSISQQAPLNEVAETPLSPARRRILAAVAFAPLALWALRNFYLASITPRRTFDVVFTHYNEPMDDFVGVIKHIRGVPSLQGLDIRFIIYVKSKTTNLREMLDTTGADEVVRRPNVGREGATYLAHILRHHHFGDLRSQPLNSRAWTEALAMGWSDRLTGERLVKSDTRGLADHTLFMQPHFAWHWLSIPRLDMFDADRTGFLSLGPYLLSDCGEDGEGKGNYERMKDIYVIFRETFCPPTKQLSSWSAQYVVSRQRVLANPYIKYSNLFELITAPADHWLHKEGDWFQWQGSTDAERKSGDPVAPFLGHAVERSWPIIFNCNDPEIAKRCDDTVRDIRGKEYCQCFDHGPSGKSLRSGYVRLRG